MIVVYGLKTCATCRKALAWLHAEGVAHRFHNLRADGLDRGTAAAWLAELGGETLVNRRSATWRGLPDDARAGLDDAGIVDLIVQHPALAKRPVFDLGDRRLVGFSDAVKRQLAARR